MITEEFINNLKNYCDIESIISLYVELKKAGRNKVCRCPFHSEKTASMVVYSHTQSFYCFGCGAGGDVITFVKKIENFDYIEAVNFLAKKAGLTVPEDIHTEKIYTTKKKVNQINTLAAKFFYNNLKDVNSKSLQQYLQDRQLSHKYIKKFGLGYAKDDWYGITNYLKNEGFTDEDLIASNLVVKGRNGKIYDMFRNRLMFPIIDVRGNVIAFGGRTIDHKAKGPKYLNSSDTILFKKSKNLYAINFAKSTSKDYIILAEGYMDVIAIYQTGSDNAVATLGTALTPDQSRLLAIYTKNVVLAYDSDEAGQKATNRAINLLGQAGISVKVLAMNGAKDPDEYIKKFGSQRFQILLKSSADALDFQIQKMKNKYDLNVSQGKVDFLKEVVTLISTISNQLEREVYISKIASELNISSGVINLQVNKNIKSQIEKKKRDSRRSLNIIGYNEKNKNTSEKTRISIAEDKIITILFKNPDYYKFMKEKLHLDNFENPINRNLFEVICDRIKNNKPLDLTNLSAIVDEDNIQKLAYLLANDLDLNVDKEILDQYVNVILEYSYNKDNQAQKMDDTEFKDYFLTLAKKKCSVQERENYKGEL